MDKAGCHEEKSAHELTVSKSSAKSNQQDISEAEQPSSTLSKDQTTVTTKSAGKYRAIKIYP